MKKKLSEVIMRTAFNVAVIILLGYSLMWGFFVESMVWTPPPEKHLTVAKGHFISNDDSKKCTNRTYCILPPLKFVTEHSQILLLNCEPYPPINECIDKKFFNNNAFFTIKYFDPAPEYKNDKIYIIMSANINGKNEFSYDERL
jgi:hypothetical protein